jgi:hypothetical protein
MSIFGSGADMVVLVLTAMPRNRFHYTFQNNSKLGFPVSEFTQSGTPLTRKELKAQFNKLLDECMPEDQ